MQGLFPSRLFEIVPNCADEAYTLLNDQKEAIYLLIESINKTNKREIENSIKESVLDITKTVHRSKMQLNNFTENQYSHQIEKNVRNFIVNYAIKNFNFKIFKVYYNGYEIPYWIDAEEPCPDYAKYGSSYIRNAISKNNVTALREFIDYNRQGFINECTSCYTALDLEIKMILLYETEKIELVNLLVNTLPLSRFGVKLA